MGRMRKGVLWALVHEQNFDVDPFLKKSVQMSLYMIEHNFMFDCFLGGTIIFSVIYLRTNSVFL